MRSSDLAMRACLSVRIVVYLSVILFISELVSLFVYMNAAVFVLNLYSSK